MSGALEGIKVVDLSRILAGPYCGRMLSDLGAEVVKVEAPWGDDARTWGPPFLDDGTAAYHLSCNRGKSFIQANLKQDPESVMSLINSADVVIENFKPGGLQSLLGTLLTILLSAQSLLLAPLDHAEMNLATTWLYKLYQASCQSQAKQMECR